MALILLKTLDVSRRQAPRWALVPHDERRALDEPVFFLLSKVSAPEHESPKIWGSQRIEGPEYRNPRAWRSHGTQASWASPLPCWLLLRVLTEFICLPRQIQLSTSDYYITGAGRPSGQGSWNRSAREHLRLLPILIKFRFMECEA